MNRFCVWLALVAALGPQALAEPERRCGVGVGAEAVATGLFASDDVVLGWRAAVSNVAEAADGAVAERSGELRQPADWKLLTLEADGLQGWRWRVLRDGDTLEVDGPAPVAMGHPPASRGCPTWTPALAEQIEIDRRALSLRAKRAYGEALALRRPAYSRLPPDAPSALRPLLERELAWDAEEAGDAELAREFYAKARDGWANLRPDSLAMADAEHLAGTQLFWLGELEAAEKHLRRSLDLRRRWAPGSPVVGRSANNLGLVRRERGYHDEAGEFLRLSLNILEAHQPGTLLLSKSYINYGAWAFGRGDIVGAEDYFRRAKALREQLAPDSLELALSLNNLAGAIEKRGDLEEAELRYRQAFEIRQRLAPDGVDVATSLGNLSRMAWMRGDSAKAIELARRAYAIHRRVAPTGTVTARSARTLASALMAAEELDEAEAVARAAMALQAEREFATIDASDAEAFLGEILRRRGRFEEARTHHRRALDLRRRLAPSSPWHASSLKALADVERSRGDREREWTYLEAALKVVDSLPEAAGRTADDRAAAHASYVDWYRRGADLLVHAGRYREAFGLLERSRARGWIAALASRDAAARPTSPDLDAERRRVGRAYERAIGRLDRVTDAEASEDLWRTITELSDRRRAVAREVYFAGLEDSGPSPAELWAPEPGSPILAFSVGDERTLVFVLHVDADGDVEIDVSVAEIPREELAIAVEQFRLLLRSPTGDIDAIRRLGLELYEGLIEPHADILAAADRVVLLPDGPLLPVPFAAFTTPSERWLAEELTLVNSPSAVLLGYLRNLDVPARPARFIAFADPTVPGGDAEVAAVRGVDRPLPESRREAKAAAGVFTSSDIHLGAAATEAAARRAAAEATVLHFATHSWINDRFPLDSYLALASSETENGRLHAFEITESVKTEAELVTLSGCETGLGRQIDGVGPQSLARAFFRAGARSVLASLWRIDDAATASLMTSFYGELARTDKAEALALAQRRLISGQPETSGLVDWARRLWPGDSSEARDLTHPYYWSGFHLLGDWRPVDLGGP
ncbi:MAG: CHAT domain-containing tetratricopeptide repeat protein [Acidobacteriota bacterium]